jgi:uncharacterized membrane protein
MSSLIDAVTWLMNQIGYAICHQFSQRSLDYGGRVLPVCARDAGLFLGFSACGAALLLIYGTSPRRYPTRPKVLVLALFIVPTIIDAATSYAGIRSTTNGWRLATGLCAGVGLAALVFPLAVTRLVSEGERREKPAAFQSWWSILLLLTVPVGISLALRPDWPGAYWVWAPLVTLSIVFTLLVLNFLLVSFLLDWLRAEKPRPGAATVGFLALVACLIELMISNRLHWLVERHL